MKHFNFNTSSVINILEEYGFNSLRVLTYTEIISRYSSDEKSNFF